MSDSYTNLLYHIVFSTKDRHPLITPQHEGRLSVELFVDWEVSHWN